MPSVGVPQNLHAPQPPEPSVAQRLAAWFDARLEETAVVPTGTVRLYGLEVLDPDGLGRLDPTAARVVYLAEAVDECTLYALPEARRLADFDAGATLQHVWVPVTEDSPRPGSFAHRRRARVVFVTDRDDDATTVRVEGLPGRD